MNNYFILIAGISATMITRFLPFVIFKAHHLNHPLLMYLTKVLPAASISLLVVYVYRHMSFGSNTLYPTLIASSVVILLHLSFKNSLVSMVFGTLVYMLLI
ncbi:MAG: branched-chain amino acid transporter permease [Acholeplasmataceae bacterium]